MPGEILATRIEPTRYTPGLASACVTSTPIFFTAEWAKVETAHQRAEWRPNFTVTIWTAIFHTLITFWWTEFRNLGTNWKTFANVAAINRFAFANFSHRTRNEGAGYLWYQGRIRNAFTTECIATILCFVRFLCSKPIWTLRT